jgi:prefoldin subunit 5
MTSNSGSSRKFETEVIQMNEIENNQIRLEWLEEQVSHYRRQINQVQADIDQLEGVKTKYSNYLDGFEAELKDLAQAQFEMA